MFVTLSYVKWSPPHISQQEQIAGGAGVAAHGKGRYVEAFKKRLTEDGLSGEPLWLKLFLGLAALGLLIAIPFVFIPVAVLWIVVYGTSYAVAITRLNAWLNRCVAAYRAANPAFGIN